MASASAPLRSTETARRATTPANPHVVDTAPPTSRWPRGMQPCNPMHTKTFAKRATEHNMRAMPPAYTNLLADGPAPSLNRQSKVSTARANKAPLSGNPCLTSRHRAILAMTLPPNTQPVRKSADQKAVTHKSDAGIPDNDANGGPDEELCSKMPGT